MFIKILSKNGNDLNIKYCEKNNNTNVVKFKKIDVNDLFDTGDPNKIKSYVLSKKKINRKFSHQKTNVSQVKNLSENIQNYPSYIKYSHFHFNFINKNLHNRQEKIFQNKKIYAKSQIKLKNFQDEKIKHNKNIEKENEKNINIRKISLNELFDNNYNKQEKREIQDLKFTNEDNNLKINRNKLKELNVNERFYKIKKTDNKNIYVNTKNYSQNQIFGGSNINKNFSDEKGNNHFYNSLQYKSNNFSTERSTRKLSEMPSKRNIHSHLNNINYPNGDNKRKRYYSNIFEYSDSNTLDSYNFNNSKKIYNQDYHRRFLNNKYDNISNLIKEKDLVDNINLFSLWDDINSEKNQKKKWFIKSYNQINYGPFSDEEIYNYLKTTLTNNPESETMKNSMVIDSEMDIYFKPDSALEVIQQEIKNIKIATNPKDDLEKILITIKSHSSKNKNMDVKEKERENDEFESNANFIIEKNISEQNSFNNLIEKNKNISEEVSVSSADLYNFIYHNQKNQISENDLINNHNIKENEKSKEIGSKYNDSPQDILSRYKNKIISQISSKDDIRINPRLQKIQLENKENKLMTVYDQENNLNNKLNNKIDLDYSYKIHPKRIKSLSHGNNSKIDSKSNFALIQKNFNMFDLKNKKDIIKNSLSQIKNKEIVESKYKPNEDKKSIITVLKKPISIEDIFQTSPTAKKLSKYTTLPKTDILREIKKFLFDDKNKIQEQDKKEYNENQNLKNLIEIGITPKIEFRKLSNDFEKSEALTVSSNTNQNSAEGNVKHFLGKKVDGSIARRIDIHIIENRKGRYLNKFDIPLHKICYTKKFSNANKNNVNSTPSSNKEPESYFIQAPHLSPNLNSDNEGFDVLNKLNNSKKNNEKKENFKKRKIDVEEILIENKLVNNIINKENLEKNLQIEPKEYNFNTSSNVKLKDIAVQDLFS